MTVAVHKFHVSQHEIVARCVFHVRKHELFFTNIPMQCRMPGVRTGGVRARARARPTHRCPFCEKLYRRLDHYQAHLHHAHEAELDRAAEWEGAPAAASGMSSTNEETHDVFKHPERPMRTSPIPAADVAASGAGGSATAHYTAMLDFVSSVMKPILTNIAPDSGVYVAALEEYQRALRAHEECTPRLSCSQT